MKTLPSSTYQELNFSTVPPAQLSDFHGLIAPVLYGPSDKPYLVTTVDGFVSQFGANGVASPYFSAIKRALSRGAAFYIQRLLATGASNALILLGASQITVNAKWAGTYANGLLGVQYSPVGAGTTCTLTVLYGPNSRVNEVWTAANYVALIALVNAQSNLITLTTGATPSEPVSSVNATVFLAAGSDGTFATPVLRAAAVNALYQNFNNLTGLTGLGAFGAYTPGDINNLQQYCASRGDVFGVAELDPSLSPTAAIAVAQALALPAGSSYVSVYWGSYLVAWSPDDNAFVSGPVLADVLAVYSYSDSVGGNPFLAPAGSTRGLLPNVSSFAYNLMAAANIAQANALVTTGVNVVGVHPAYGPVVWGAQTMNQLNSSLDAINVRRFMIWLHASLQPVYDGELFEQMDPVSWRNAYNQAKVILNYAQGANAIDEWTYTGDQFVSTLADAVYNQPTGLANGLYKVLINVVPNGYISSIAFTAEINNLLSLFQSAVTTA